MEKAFEKLPEFIYDIVGIFIPSAYFYLCLCLIYDGDFLEKFFNVELLNRTFTLIFLIYFFGHVLYSISNLLIAKIFNRIFGQPAKMLLTKEPKKRQILAHRFLFIGTPTKTKFFLDSVRKGIERITGEKDFDIEGNVDITFEICRNYVMEKTKQRVLAISREQAYGEMSRAIIFVSMIAIPWIMIVHNFDGSVSNFWIKTIFFAVTGIAFSYRYLQSRMVIPYFIYLAFSTIAIEKIK